MICTRCRASVIGNPPGHLLSTGLCQPCYRVYLTEQTKEEEQEEAKQKEVEAEQKRKVKEEKKAEEEKIDNRFDILDF